MNYDGVPVPPWKGDKKRYIISAGSLRGYLEMKWGKPDQSLPPESVESLENRLRANCKNGLFVVSALDHIGVVKLGYEDPYPGSLEDGGLAWLLED